MPQQSSAGAMPKVAGWGLGPNDRRCEACKFHMNSDYAEFLHNKTARHKRNVKEASRRSSTIKIPEGTALLVEHEVVTASTGRDAPQGTSGSSQE